MPFNYAALITAVLKVGMPVYLAVLIGTSLLIFLPTSIINQIGVDEFRKAYRLYFGLLFITSLSLIISYALCALSLPINKLLNKRQVNKARLNRLRSLTDDEKNILRNFIFEGRTTVEISAGQGILGSLVNDGIVKLASRTFHYYSIPYFLEPSARKMLEKRPELLD